MSDSAEKQRERPGRLHSKTLGQVALEVFSIVLGVLLALAVSEWQESRSNLEKSQLALSNVRAELQGNLKLLETIHPINSRVVEQLSSGETDSSRDETVVPGVQIRSSAWQTLSTTGVGNYVDYDLLIELSQLYSLIDVYRQTAYGVINSNMNVAATATALDRGIDNKRLAENFLPFFQMLNQIEAALIPAHAKAISLIDQATGQ
jgi:hypothetical protein